MVVSEADQAVVAALWELELAELAWRLVLRACRAARNASNQMGPRGVAQAVGYELVGTDTIVVTAAKAVLVTIAAKGNLGTGLDLDEIDRVLRRHQTVAAEIASRSIRRPARRRPRSKVQDGEPGVDRGDHHQGDRPEPLRVDDARAVPILGLLERYGFRLRRIGREYVTRCPFHDDRRPSLQVNPAKGLWHCFPCGIGGDGIALVERLRGCTFAEAVREVVGC